MKRLFAPALAIAFSLALAAAVWAQGADSTASLDRAANQLVQQYKAASRSAERITNLKAAGVKTIDTRLADVDRLINKINGLSVITSSDKTALVSILNSAKSGLETLSTKIQGDTDLATLKADIKSIFTAYRIYEVVNPKVSGLIVADRITALITKLQSVSGKLSGLITSVNASGKDTTQMSTFFSDYQTQITAAQSQVAAAKTSFEAMDVTDTTAAKTDFEAGKADLKTAMSDLQNARRDLQSIIPLLKADLPEATSSAHTATGSAQ